MPLDRARRRPAPRRVLVAAAVIALLAGAGIATVAGDDAPVTIAGPSATPVETVPLTLEERAAAAMLAQAETTVVREDITGPVPLVRWVDGATGDERKLWTTADGTPLAEEATTPLRGSATDSEVIAVDHCARTVHFALEDGVTSSVLAELARGLGANVWAADGTEVVDGRELIRMRSWPLGIPGGVLDAAGRGEPPTADQWDPTMALYLDPETLLPVLERTRIGEDDELRTTYTLLPRTAVNRAQTLVTVPDDYERRPGAEWAEPTEVPDGC